MLTLLQKQKVFIITVAKFINDLTMRGYDITGGELYRPLPMAVIYASTKQGILASNHTIRLAIDLNIFYNDEYLTSKEDLAIPGNLWKTYSTQLVECCWGGDFETPDSDHFSFEHNGIK